MKNFVQFVNTDAPASTPHVLGHQLQIPMNKVHHEKVGALHPIHGGLDGKTDARRKLSARFSFFKLFRLRNNGDFHASDHVCVYNTPTKVAYERNTLSRVAEDVRMSCIDCWFFCVFQKLVLITGAKLLHVSLSSSPQSLHFTPYA